MPKENYLGIWFVIQGVVRKDHSRNIEGHWQAQPPYFHTSDLPCCDGCNYTPTQLLTLLSAHQVRESEAQMQENSLVKIKKSLISKAKLYVQALQNKESLYLFQWAGRQPGKSQKAASQHTQLSPGRTNTRTMNAPASCFLLLFLSFY